MVAPPCAGPSDGAWSREPPTTRRGYARRSALCIVTLERRSFGRCMVGLSCGCFGREQSSTIVSGLAAAKQRSDLRSAQMVNRQLTQHAMALLCARQLEVSARGPSRRVELPGTSTTKGVRAKPHSTLVHARFLKKPKRTHQKGAPTRKKNKKIPLEKVCPRARRSTTARIDRPPTSASQILHYLVHRYRVSQSSRVRASAKSARCQPASPSKVDRTDEAVA